MLRKTFSSILGGVLLAFALAFGGVMPFSGLSASSILISCVLICLAIYSGVSHVFSMVLTTVIVSLILVMYYCQNDMPIPFFVLKSLLVVVAVYCAFRLYIKLGLEYTFLIQIGYIALLFVLTFGVASAMLSLDAAEYSMGDIYDKNFLGQLSFLFFVMSIKLKRYAGILVVSSFALFVTNSRSFVGEILFFFAVELLFQIKAVKNIFCEANRVITLLLGYTVLTIVVICASYYVVDRYSDSTVSEYKEGIVDGSNLMRCTANVYAINYIKEQSLWFVGLGGKIREELGVEDEETSVRIEGVRLVQPHNSFLNYAMRAGVVMGFVYFVLLLLLVGELATVCNLSILIPYLINSQFMHNMLSSEWLLLFITVILISGMMNCNGRKSKWQFI